MANAKRDENFVPTITAILNDDGTTITNLTAEPTTHGLDASDGSTGSDMGPTGLALRDGNFVTTLIAVSEADGETPVPIYANSDGKILIDSN